MRVAGLGLLLAYASWAVSCGGGSGNGGTSSCLYSFTSGAAGEAPAAAASCREWKGASDQVAARQQDCASAAGPTDGGLTVSSMFSLGPCPVANIVGGCRDTVGGITYTDWYYGPDQPTVAEVMAACAEEAETFVPAP
jgi:hypothetical protein